MINISIDLPKNLQNMLINGNLPAKYQTAIQMAVSSTLMAAKSKWESEAQKRLTTTRNDYLLGLNADNSVEFPDPFTGILTLRGKWPNMLEKGFPAFDMKQGGDGRFKNSPKRKMKKDGGWYLTIPMRHRTPDTVGSAVGGGAMPQDIYAQARLLAAGQRLTGTEAQYPPRVSWTGYQHKNGIYEGMQRNQKVYEKAVQSTYFTFRRVSDKSDPRSWWHPGFQGIEAADLVAPFVRDTFQKVLADYLKKASGGP
jgi:hypothetical protein